MWYWENCDLDLWSRSSHTLWSPNRNTVLSIFPNLLLDTFIVRCFPQSQVNTLDCSCNCNSTIFAVSFQILVIFPIWDETVGVASSREWTDSSDITILCVVQSAWAPLISLNSLEALIIYLFNESAHPLVKKTKLQTSAIPFQANYYYYNNHYYY